MKNPFQEWVNAGKSVHGLVIPAYLLVATVTPALGALDSNAPGFFALAVLNLLVFTGFVFTGYFKNHPEYARAFFSSPAGWIYTAFVLVALPGIFLSGNRVESVLQWARIVTVYAAVFNLTMILMRDMESVKRIVLLMTGLLFLDAGVVFIQGYRVFMGQLDSILEITFVYSNKNILAAAIFIKLAFALWLMLFETGRRKLMGWAAFGAGVGAVILLGARSFYLGLVILFVIFMVRYLVGYVRTRGRRSRRVAVSRLGGTIAGIMILAAACLFFFSEIKENRLVSMVSGHLVSPEKIDSASLRLDAWQWSWALIKDNPWLGVGTGNWKTAVLQHENRKNPGFVYLCRAHNDFLETMSETGVLGGLLFAGLCAAVIRQFICCRVNPKCASGPLVKYHFLSAAGILCYSVDAFFNFPADRPEIMVLFAVFVSIAIAADVRQKKCAGHQKYREKQPKFFSARFFFLVRTGAILLLAGSCWVLYLNFQSLKTQRIVYQEIHSGSLTQKAEAVAAGLPFMPNISLWGEPVAVLKARYLIHENQFQAAIDLLEQDNSSPYDSRREFFTAMAYHRLGDPETALAWSETALKLKPNYFEHLLMAVLLLEETGNYLRASRHCDAYLAQNKREKRAWILAGSLHIRNNNFAKAGRTIEQALTFFPVNQSLRDQKQYVIDYCQEAKGCF